MTTRNIRRRPALVFACVVCLPAALVQAAVLSGGHLAAAITAGIAGLVAGAVLAVGLGRWLGRRDRRRAGRSERPALRDSLGAEERAEWDTARLVALNMAQEGRPREEAGQFLTENFGIREPESLLSEAYDGR